MARYGKGLLLLAAAALVGCGSDNDIATAEDSPKSDFRALFSASDGVLPFPINLLFNASDSGPRDGTLNFPFDDDSNDDGTPDSLSVPRVALNDLDGFSTMAPISTNFGSAIDPLSVAGNVRLFEVSLSGIAGAVTALGSELQFGVDFVATPSSVAGSANTLVIVPLRALKASQSYMVAISTGLKSTSGDPALPDNQYRLLQRTTELTQTEFPLLTAGNLQLLNQLRLLVNSQEAQLAQASPALPSDQVSLSWTFTTQSLGGVMEKARGLATATSGNFVFVGDTDGLLPGGSQANAANVYAGTLSLPYYLSNASGASGSGGPVQDAWQGAGGIPLTGLAPGATDVPVKRSDETIPLLVSVPKQGSAPWPVVIFQHGITRNRTDMVAVADAFAAAGMAVVAIDLPLHGLPPGHPVRAATPAATERTFDLDRVTQDSEGNTTDPENLDSVPDASGTHFINLASLLTSRDNVRQGAADLFALVKAIPAMDFDGGGPDFSTNNLGFVGMSLGGIVGTSFLAHEDGVGPAVLANPGGGIAKLLDGSPRFGPVIAAGLASRGVSKGSADYEAFLGAAQTAIDAGDPLNSASAAAAKHPVLMFQVNGDQTIPNTVPVPGDNATVASPTAGTVPLAAAMGLVDVSATTSGTGLDARIRFTAGNHGSLISPAASLAVTQTMQNAMVKYIGSGGALVEIADTSVVQ